MTFNVRNRHIYITFLIATLTLLVYCSKQNEPAAAFSYTKDCSNSAYCKISFKNQSQYADSYKWDFGDGESSTEVNPVHNFPKGKEYYVVTLKAINISEAKENFKKDTVFIVEKPDCENIGSFACAKRLESGVAASDNIGADQKNNYYFFVTPKEGAVKIQLSPVPAGQYVYVDLLSEARDNSPVIKSVYGYPGETIEYYAGPVSKDSFYIKVRPYNNNQDNYNITYTYITDDSNELNNTFAQATALALNKTKSGTILAAGDVDYYKFTLAHGGVVDIELSPVPGFPSGYLTLQIYNEANSNSQLKSKNGYPGETIKLSAGPLEAGEHYILIKATKESPEKYNLTVSLDETDTHEINNSFSTATTILNNQSMKGTIKSAEDVDYYMFTAIQNGNANIKIDKVPIGLRYLYVEVYSEANASSRIDKQYAAQGNSINFQVAKPLVAGKNYYIKLYGYYSDDESGEPYTFSISQ